MSATDIFVVHAVSVGAGLTPTQKPHKQPLNYLGENMEYYIEFK